MNISEVLPNGNVRVVVPIKFRCVKQTKVIVFPENEIGIQMQTPLLTAIANALAWQQMLDEGVIPSVDALAKHVGKERAIVSHTLQLALLSPEIIHMAIIGTLPKEITLRHSVTVFLQTGKNRRRCLASGKSSAILHVAESLFF